MDRIVAVMRTWAGVLVPLVLVSFGAGCASAKANLEPELPPLVTPPPPPRVLPPLDGRPLAAAGVPPGEPAPAARPAVGQRVEEPRQNDAAARSDPKTETPRVEAPTDSARSAEDAGPSSLTTGPVLQLAPGGDAPVSEQSIRRQLVRASGDLNRVDYGALNHDTRAQYDTAKRFMTLAEQAIRDRNFIFAQTLADKAGVIAAVLLRR